ncbi:hypothetical protein L810_6110 [Burkholderia sp. AU4i]|nr:hypothetical protein L810_6110 [Burkholderia sp. AU4i]
MVAFPIRREADVDLTLPAPAMIGFALVEASVRNDAQMSCK